MDPISIVAVAFAAVVVPALQRLLSSFTNRDVAEERTRLADLVGVSLTDSKKTGVDADADLDSSGDPQSKAAISTVENDRFARLLIDYYAHGLVQAKRSSTASLVSSSIGGVVILGGVALAIFRGDEPFAALIVSLSGVVTNATGLLFHRQASQALKHMEGQTRNLREDMRKDRDSDEAVQLLNQIGDDVLQDRLRAGVILRLADAQLPDLQDVRKAATVSHESSNKLQMDSGDRADADSGLSNNGTNSAASSHGKADER